MPGPLVSEHVIRTDAPADDPARLPTPHSAALWGILKPLVGIWKATFPMQSVSSVYAEGGARR
jgi:hypothetical protein